jgi:hypothetical protein
MAGGNNKYPFDASDVADPHLGTHTQEEKEALAAEWNRNQEAKDAKRNHYTTKRKAEYPNWQDQLDMQYWDKINATSIWSDLITKIKSDNPKE